jgi:drug/metabolite transporter (DMT)-like permease
MIVQAVVLALAAAGLHAMWNVRLKSAGDPLKATARAMAASAVLITPAGAVVWLLAGRPSFPPEALLLVVLSALGEFAYFNFLSAAYRRGDLSLVYPLARGTAPLLAIAAGIMLGERLSKAGYLGIALVLAGIWAVRRPSAAGAATGYALLTGAAIATYSAINSVGTRLISPWQYGWAVWTVSTSLLLLWVRFDPRDTAFQGRDIKTDLRAADRSSWFQDFTLGVMMAVPYFLVLTALSLAPLLVVAPVRESAIVLVTLWSVLRLGERDGAGMRVGGALALLGGIVFLVV